MTHMRPFFAFVLCAAGTPLASGQARPASPEVAAILNFEAEDAFRPLPGWQINGDAAPDFASVHSGRRAARIERKEDSALERSAMSAIYLELEPEFWGKRLELRGFVRAEKPTGSAALFLRQVDCEGKGTMARSAAISGAPRDSGGLSSAETCAPLN